MLSISQAIDIINNRRNSAELKAFYTLQKLRQDKIFADLEVKMDSLSFNIAKNLAHNIKTSKLEEDLLKTTQQFNQRLTELGYSPKDLKVEYTCSKCKDTGFIKGEHCSCLRRIIIKSAKSNYTGPITNITSFDEITFDIYKDEFRKGYKNTFTQLQRYTQKFPNVIPFLLLIGDVGTGKSYMASVVTNNLVEKGALVLFLNACDLNDLFLQYHLADITDKEKIFSPLIDCDLLVIDDLGSENIFNNVTVTYLYKLIIKRNNKNTIITTNLHSTELESRYNKRIASRLMDKNLTINVFINGIDLRINK